MSFLWLISVLVLFLMITVPSEAAAHPMAKPGCEETCPGNSTVIIPYPFGIGGNCAINASYVVICRDSQNSTNSSTPYLSKLNLEVLQVSLRQQTIKVRTGVSMTCPDQVKDARWDSDDLAGSPFLYAINNNLILRGCGNVFLSQEHDDDHVLSGCTSVCKSNNTLIGCFGINCCSTSIPFYINKYQLKHTVTDFNGSSCGYAFLAGQRNQSERFSYPTIPLQPVPVVLSWTLHKSDINSIRGCSVSNRSLQLKSHQMYSYQCQCETLGLATFGYKINSYLDEECTHAVPWILGREMRNRKIAAIVGASAGVGVLFLVVAIFTLYKVVKRRSKKKRREKFFKQNGGLLLQQQLSADEGAVEKTMLFTAKELCTASDGFNKNRILGQGGQSTVYKGMLTDGRIVAIKISKKVDENQLDQFINEIVILSQVKHRNVVKLLGCCLETEVPLLVYEFIPNGTLFDHLHNDQNDEELPLTWDLRLRIATEVAGAVAYLHSSVSNPIFHRDIKSSNILLDEKYIAKVSDFGTSKSVAVDKTHSTTMVKGTFGYLDPEYFQSSQFTDKSDVYSFGVVLAELLTRQKAISSSVGTDEDGNLSLATRFLTYIDQDSLKNILDPQVVNQENEQEVIAVAKLAQRCLRLNGRKRPTMREVAIGLGSIKLSAMRSATLDDFQSPSFIEGGPSVFSDYDYTWITESDSTRSATGIHPLLST